MSSIMRLLSMADIDINVHDPRKNGDFLILSHSINDYNAHLNDGAYWLTMEKRCLSLINETGYDLQTGVWLCLIETKVHGWDGLACSSLLFSRFLAKENPSCWPGADPGHIRAQIIEWYSNNVIPAIARLNRDDLRISSRTAMIQFLEIFLQQQIVLQSGKCPEFRLLLREMKSEKRSNKKNHFSSVDIQGNHYQKDKINDGVINNKGDVQYYSLTKNKGYSFTMYTLFFITGVIIACGAGYISKPEVAWKLEKIMPGNIISSYVLDGLDCNYHYHDDSWVKLKNRVDDFEHRINNVEKEGGYLTLSEIKTIIHQMQIEMLQNEQPVLTQINYIENKITRGEKPDSVNLKIVDDNVKGLNCRLARIHAELSY